ncbi:MAG: serine/threonine protein kinase [Mangrovicoccus sp.]|nr:serine/threonine protein kinase [Mangrovicoccus sp.]
MFAPDTVLKRDAFSETVLGQDVQSGQRLILRRLDQLAQPGRMIGRFLARREARALQAVQGIAGTPHLLRFDDQGLLRDWIEGTPLQAARPEARVFYRDAARILRAMHRRGVTHNDLQKPQNWLMMPDGRAAVIDFQLATVSQRRGRLFRLRAYEDLRHLAKQKSRYAPHLMTARERAFVAHRSWPSRQWHRFYKPVYHFITRQVMHWSDGEGAGVRLRQEGPGLRAALMAHPKVREVAISTYPVAGGGQGLYGFVECDFDIVALRGLLREDQIELLQPVAQLPCDAKGQIRQDVLDLIAMNRIPELTPLMAQDADLASILAPIIAYRLNLSDRA